MTIVVMTLLMVFWTFNNFVYVWLATGGPGLFTNVLATEILIKAFIDFELGFSRLAWSWPQLAFFGVAYFRFVAMREFARSFDAGRGRARRTRPAPAPGRTMR